MLYEVITGSYQVFNIDGADLLSSWGIASISGIPADATVVINVSGKDAGMVNANFNALVPIRNKVLFNFYEADTLTFKGVGVEGSVLAPYADVVDPQGVINGTIIAKSVITSYSIHYTKLYDRALSTERLLPNPGAVPCSRITSFSREILIWIFPPAIRKHRLRLPNPLLSRCSVSV